MASTDAVSSRTLRHTFSGLDGFRTHAASESFNAECFAVSRALTLAAVGPMSVSPVAVTVASAVTVADTGRVSGPVTSDCNLRLRLRGFITGSFVVGSSDASTSGSAIGESGLSGVAYRAGDPPWNVGADVLAVLLVTVADGTDFGCLE